MDETLNLLKRHGDHHFANVKYGYAVLFLIFVHLVYLYVSRKIYLRKWITSGRASSHKKLVSLKDTWILAVWVTALTGLLFIHFSPHEITVFVKRMGRFAYVLVPFDIFLSLKPNPLPNVYYLELIFLHKWISRLIVLLGFLHSVAFIIIWLVRGQGQIMKMFRLLNFLGVIAMIGFIISTFVSLRFFRRRFYKTFFTTHIVIAWAVVFLLQFHARPGVTFYTLLNLSLILVQFIAKAVKSTNVSIETSTHSNSSLKIIQLDNIWYRNFVPGSHLRLSYSKLNPLTYLLPSHPFTIASRSEESKIKLVVKENSTAFRNGEIHSVFGPFPSIYPNFFQTADKVVLIAGGSGISLTLGVYEELIKNSSVSVTMIWILRNKEDLWILNHFSINKIDIYITASKQELGSNLSHGGIEEDDFEEIEQLLGDTFNDDDGLEDRESFELNELDPFDDSNQIDGRTSNIQIQYGRPDFTAYSHKFNGYDRANNWVISCGSAGLNKTCKKWADGLNVRYHSESYDL